MHTIQEIYFPSLDTVTRTDLYFRTRDLNLNIKSKVITLRKNQIVTFDTYFNSFSIGKWKRYTNIEDLQIYLDFSGSIRVDIFHSLQFNKNELLDTILIDHGDCRKVSLVWKMDMRNRSYDGIIHFRIIANRKVQIFGGFYATETGPLRSIRMAVIIPTYHREEYIRKRIQDVDMYYRGRQCNIKLYIIDNARTLQEEEESHYYKILHNTNSGGAGGFARGLLEAKRDARFTHYLLTDDDIELEPGSYERLASFLKHQVNIKDCVSGAMLRLDERNIQHENGAILGPSSNLIPMKLNFDLTSFDLVLLNEKECAKDYAAWWFFCFSKELLNELGFPMPFFFRWDDVEFALRLRNYGARILDLNGLCAWHEPFGKKYSSVTIYYEERNSLICRSIHEEGFSYIRFLTGFMRKVLLLSFLMRYESAEMCLRAYADFLRGCDFIAGLDPESHHRQLLAIQKEKTQRIPPQEFVPKPINPPYSRQVLKNWLAKLTFNGHLLPPFLLSSARHKLNRGVKYLDTLNRDYRIITRARKVLYLYEPESLGFWVSRDYVRFWKTMGKLILITLTSWRRFAKAKKSYKSAHARLTSEQFWLSYLGLK